MHRPAIPPSPKAKATNFRSQIAATLRRTVGARLMRDFGVRVPPALIRRVLDEVMQLAQETGYPMLLFPILAEEKARLVHAALAQPVAHRPEHSLRNAA